MTFSLLCRFNRCDLVDLTRQVLSKYANQVYLDALAAFLQKDARNLDLYSRRFVELIKDIDELLASDGNFLLGTWLESAKALASNPTDLRQARIQRAMHFTIHSFRCSDTPSHHYLELRISSNLSDYELTWVHFNYPCCSSTSGMRGHK